MPRRARPATEQESEQETGDQTIRMEIMRTCFCSELSRPEGRRKLKEGEVCDLHLQDAKALHDKRFARIAWPE